MTEQFGLKLTNQVAADGMPAWMNGAHKGATFDKTGRYRYVLWRVWSAKPWLLVFMLNPSVADHELDDNTIKAVTRHCEAKLYGGFIVVNLYAYTATEPRDLFMALDKRNVEVVGPENGKHILMAMSECRAVWCAWGAHARPERIRAVMPFLKASNLPLYHVGLTKDGMPRHPLYIKTDQPFITWSPT